MSVNLINSKGFTIVELLIAIVVIGILAAITIVAFNGIQTRGHDPAVKSDLTTLHKKLELFKATNDKYPSVALLSQLDFKASKGSYAIDPVTTHNIDYCYEASLSQYGIGALSKSGNAFYISYNSGGVRDFPVAWPSTETSTCAAIGASLSTIWRGYGANDTTSGPWRIWVGGN